MEKSVLPLNDWQARKKHRAINRFHTFSHGLALLALFYYRITSIAAALAQSSSTPNLVAQLLIFTAELILSFIWFLSQAAKWNPIVRTAYPDRLPADDNLPAIDVFVCTADPTKEPSLSVMNTVISAMALDYPPHKLHVYLSDDGGSPITLRALKEAWGFAKLWIPFCRKYKVKNRCPQAYFATEEEISGDDMFLVEKNYIEEAYEDFKISLGKILTAVTNSRVGRDHPPIIEVMNDANDKKLDSDKDPQMPLVVYVAREKRPSHAHHFKAGALNVLLRVSGVMSNSPYILMLDCDMYCNDPTSARQAMCFHLDPNLSDNLGFVQFPQKFYNLSHKDLYDGDLRYAWEKFEGLDGLRGPVLSGTGFYIKREALYGTQHLQKNVDTIELAKSFGSSEEFIRSVDFKNYKPNYSTDPSDNYVLEKQVQLLASCSYDDGTEWGEQVGFRYFTVVEDAFTGMHLHCDGWISVYYSPPNPCFLGASPVSLAEVLVQHTRWGLGLNQIAFSKFSPLLYGILRRMSILQSMCYAEFAYYQLYCVPLYILALLPQFCLIRGIRLYPQISSPFFPVFVFIFLSSQAKHVEEVLIMGYPIRAYFFEQRMWMIKSLTSQVYANLNTVMDKIGFVKASFLPTNKVVDEGAEKLYHMGKYNFEAPSLFMVPLCTIYILNLASFVVGFGRSLHGQEGKEEGVMLIEGLIPLFGLIMHLPLLEGMVLRKDKGRVPSNVSLLSLLVSSIALAYASSFATYLI